MTWFCREKEQGDDDIINIITPLGDVVKVVLSSLF